MIDVSSGLDSLVVYVICPRESNGRAANLYEDIDTAGANVNVSR